MKDTESVFNLNLSR